MDTPADLVLSLLEKDTASPKRIAVVGDAGLDVWSQGTLGAGQEACPKFTETSRIVTPGMAGNATRQLQRWNSNAFLLAPIPDDYPLEDTIHCLHGAAVPVKYRHYVEGRCVYRVDVNDTCHEASWQAVLLSTIKRQQFDAVLISDYAKGFLEDGTIREIVSFCVDNGIPVVADPKRNLKPFDGAVIKCNHLFVQEHDLLPSHNMVTTFGDKAPFVCSDGYTGPCMYFNETWQSNAWNPVPCVNHVGAGDCFAAHLTLALAHGFSLPDAARIAHSAGRVFVQHPHARPPFPHEIRRDLMGQWGKVLPADMLPALRLSTSGKIVFTNGVFRLPHPGHNWLLNWARQQGDMLVVGVNDDASARLNKGPENFILPLHERLEWLTSLQAVDYVVPYTWPTPPHIIRALKPELLVKGHEFAGQAVPGSELCELRLAPPNAYPRHCTDLVEEIKAERA